MNFDTCLDMINHSWKSQRTKCKLERDTSLFQKKKIIRNLF